MKETAEKFGVPRDANPKRARQRPKKNDARREVVKMKRSKLLYLV